MPKKTKAAPAPAGMTVETVPLDSLHLDPANARLHGDKNLDAIKASLKEFGQVEALVCARDGKIIGGNGRYEAMRSLGWTHASVHYVDASDIKQTSLGIALNRTAELAEWDHEVLESLLTTLKDSDVDVASLGYDDTDLAALAEQFDGASNEGEDSNNPIDEEILRAEFTQADDARQAMLDVAERRTSHACLHGDCLQLLRDLPPQSVAMWFCDLPYGTTNNGWDCPIDIDVLWGIVSAASRERNAVIFTGTQPFSTSLINACQEKFRYEMIWDKGVSGSFACAPKRPLPIHENILIFGNTDIYVPQMTKRDKPIKAPSSINKGVDPTTGARRKSAVTIYEQKYPESIVSISSRSDKRSDRVHTTQKPLALLEWLIRTYTNPGDLVVDPTMGSGTTGAACATTGRRFIGCEMDKAYYEGACGRIAKAYRNGVDPLIDAPALADDAAAVV